MDRHYKTKVVKRDTARLTMRFLEMETDIAYLCVGKGNAGAVDRDPGAPLDSQHQGAHREYHAQHIPSHSNSKYAR